MYNIIDNISKIFETCDNPFKDSLGKGSKKKKKEGNFHLWFWTPLPSKDGKVEAIKTSFRILMAFSPIIGIKDGKSKKILDPPP